LLADIIILGPKKWTIYRTRLRECLKGKDLMKIRIGARSGRYYYPT
jgi:hypothetical protein